MTHMTTLDELNQHITLLADVEETDAPFISCYLNLENGPAGWRDALDERARILRRLHKGNDLSYIEEALGKIEAWLTSNLLPESKGVAVFVRGTFGGSFMLPMQFAAPLPTWITVYPTPNIYHLVELKDNYHRYVVLLAKPDRVCILEVNLGAASIKAWINEPALRRRVGQEWGRPRYQVIPAHSEDHFVYGKVAVLEQLMRSGGHTHLILAGDPEITQQIHHALPKDLVDKLVEIIPADETAQQADVVMATLSSFIEHEEQESRSVVVCMVEGLRGQNRAVAGLAATLDALRWGGVDTLVMANDFQPDPGWICTDCKAYGIEVPETSVCPYCAAESVRPLDIKESILRLAGQSECPVEVVEQSDVLMSLGGVGCLLRTCHDKPNTLSTEPPRPYCQLQRSVACDA